MKEKIVYWFKTRPVKKEFKRISKELKKAKKELSEISTRLESLSLLSGGSGDPLPDGSGFGILKKDNHAINNS